MISIISIKKWIKGLNHTIGLSQLSAAKEMPLINEIWILQILKYMKKNKNIF